MPIPGSAEVILIADPTAKKSAGDLRNLLGGINQRWGLVQSEFYSGGSLRPEVTPLLKAICENAVFRISGNDGNATLPANFIDPRQDQLSDKGVNYQSLFGPAEHAAFCQQLNCTPWVVVNLTGPYQATFSLAAAWTVQQCIDNALIQAQPYIDAGFTKIYFELGNELDVGVFDLTPSQYNARAVPVAEALVAAFGDKVVIVPQSKTPYGATVVNDHLEWNRHVYKAFRFITDMLSHHAYHYENNLSPQGAMNTFIKTYLTGALSEKVKVAVTESAPYVQTYEERAKTTCVRGAAWHSDMLIRFLQNADIISFALYWTAKGGFWEWLKAEAGTGTLYPSAAYYAMLAFVQGLKNQSLTTAVTTPTDSGLVGGDCNGVVLASQDGSYSAYISNRHSATRETAIQIPGVTGAYNVLIRTVGNADPLADNSDGNKAAVEISKTYVDGTFDADGVLFVNTDQLPTVWPYSSTVIEITPKAQAQETADSFAYVELEANGKYTVEKIAFKRPAPFTLTNSTYGKPQTYLAWFKSDPVTFDFGGASASISVSGTGLYRIGAGAFTRDPGTINAGQTFEVAHNNANGRDVKTSTFITVDGATIEWASTTADVDIATVPVIDSFAALSTTALNAALEAWPAGADTVEMQLSAASNFASIISTATFASPSVLDADFTGLTAGTTYYARARAVNMAGNSAYSATASQATNPASGVTRSYTALSAMLGFGGVIMNERNIQWQQVGDTVTIWIGRWEGNSGEITVNWELLDGSRTVANSVVNYAGLNRTLVIPNLSYGWHPITFQLQNWTQTDRDHIVFNVTSVTIDNGAPFYASATNQTYIRIDDQAVINSGRLWLDKDHPSASDSNPGTQSLPFATPQKLLDEMVSQNKSGYIVKAATRYETLTKKSGATWGGATINRLSGGANYNDFLCLDGLDANGNRITTPFVGLPRLDNNYQDANPGVDYNVALHIWNGSSIWLCDLELANSRMGLMTGQSTVTQKILCERIYSHGHVHADNIGSFRMDFCHMGVIHNCKGEFNYDNRPTSVHDDFYGDPAIANGVYNGQTVYGYHNGIQAFNAEQLVVEFSNIGYCSRPCYEKQQGNATNFLQSWLVRNNFIHHTTQSAHDVHNQGSQPGSRNAITCFNTMYKVKSLHYQKDGGAYLAGWPSKGGYVFQNSAMHCDALLWNQGTEDMHVGSNIISGPSPELETITPQIVNLQRAENGVEPTTIKFMKGNTLHNMSPAEWNIDKDGPSEAQATSLGAWQAAYTNIAIASLFMDEDPDEFTTTNDPGFNDPTNGDFSRPGAGNDSIYGPSLQGAIVDAYTQVGNY